MAATTTPSPRCECPRPTECVERRPGRYLTAAYWLLHDRNDRLSTGELGDELAVTPASVTEMVGRLADRGLVDYESHAGIELTDRGETVARELAWRQCLVRTYFATALGAELDAATGYRIGYVLPAAAIERLGDLAAHGGERTCRGAACRHERCLFDARADG